MGRAIGAGLVLLLLLTACSSSSDSRSHAHVVLDENDNGHTVHVTPGDVVELQLHNTYWQVAPSSGGELVVASHKVTGESPSSRRCVPGQGCGTVTVDFRAARSGAASLNAHRTSCGEARRCTGAQGTFSVQVIVG